jgi:preprotein translocase subunit SecY
MIMCCIFASLLLLGPRVVGLFWWILRPAYWQLAFSHWIWPVLGLIFLPWTTLMYLLVFAGGITGFDWLWIGLAVVADIASYGGSAYGNRDYIPGYQKPTTPPM